METTNLSQELLQKIADELHVHKELLEAHKVQIGIFFKAFQEEQERSRLTGVKIDNMQTQVSILTSHLSNLSQLPFLTKAIETQGVATKELRESLVAPATGNNRTDNKTVYLLLAFGSIIIASLIFILGLVVLPDNSNLTVKSKLGDYSMRRTDQKIEELEKKTDSLQDEKK